MIKTDLSGFVVTMHSGLCELGLVSHAPSCIVTTNPSRAGLNPTNITVEFKMIDKSWMQRTMVTEAVNYHGMTYPLQWCHNERHCVSNHWRLGCLLSRLLSRKSGKISKLRITGLCELNSPVTGGFLSQRARNADNVSIWWRHHVRGFPCMGPSQYKDTLPVHGFPL